MNSESDFIRAIVSDPDNPVLRLFFADWLEERGDPRASFLRGEYDLSEAERWKELRYRRDCLKELSLRACVCYVGDCAESVLHVWEEYDREDKRPHEAVAASRRWLVDASADAAAAACGAAACAAYDADAMKETRAALPDKQLADLGTFGAEFVR